MNLERRIIKIEYLAPSFRGVFQEEIERVFGKFDMNIKDCFAYGSAMSGYRLVDRKMHCKDFPKGFEKISTKYVDELDLVLIVKNFKTLLEDKDPISDKRIYKPSKNSYTKKDDVWLPDPNKEPRICFSHPDKKGTRHIEEHYRIIRKIIGDKDLLLKIDYNVVSEEQYLKWQYKIPRVVNGIILSQSLFN